MTTIAKQTRLVTLINVFTVEPAQQPQLLNLLDQATAVVRLAPGFISANLHRSLDGTKVAMYAQWQSVEHYHAMREPLNRVEHTRLGWIDAAGEVLEDARAASTICGRLRRDPLRRARYGVRERAASLLHRTRGLARHHDAPTL